MGVSVNAGRRREPPVYAAVATLTSLVIDEVPLVALIRQALPLAWTLDPDELI